MNARSSDVSRFIPRAFVMRAAHPTHRCLRSEKLSAVWRPRKITFPPSSHRFIIRLTRLQLILQPDNFNLPLPSCASHLRGKIKSD
jgi:hypothetical protein